MRFLIYSTLLALGIWLFLYEGAEKGWFLIPPAAVTILIFLSISTALLYRLLSTRLGRATDEFTKLYLGSVVLRILIYGLFIGTILYLDGEHARGNATFFMLSYLLFTILEIAVLFLKINSASDLSKKEKES
ncbi:MAG: hypothetical protein JST46_00395 [Bacteroidetes bacterium]|nr:hypothetical protein [Bacteroidota bacterium]